MIDLWDLTTSRRLRAPRTSRAFDPLIKFAPDGRRMLFKNHDAIQVWDLVTGASSDLVEQGFLNDYGFSPDGTLLAVAWGNIVWLFDGKSNRRVGALRGHQSSVISLVFSPDGHFLATACYDRTAKLWDLKTERELATLGGHDDAVYSVAFSADADRLITISGDGSAKVWDLAAVMGRNLLLKNSTHNW